ncbi:MAG: molybdopterin-dependent oxidoreductase, partial [Gallionellaceae bacterium]|nr:molybdopterin-dependent oxidoreductase [Gallionellaceae bacterium]
MKELKNNFGRRSFLKLSATAGLLAMANRAFAASPFLTPVVVDNPLKAYPSRDWEKVYRDMYHEDSHFIFMCIPNDTHNCLLKAHVKNDVVVRISPSYGYGDAVDMDGRKASHRWDPRCCNKGIVLARRIYSDRRPKGAMVRKGFKEWADAGYPRNDPNGFPEKKYLQRGKEPFIKLPWDEAFMLAAKTLHNIAVTYSGESGAKLLEKQGYDHDMIHSMHGAGTKTMKFRGAMALLGIIRIYGQKRMANMMALLDANVRKVGPEEAMGAKILDSYTWHTDLAPGTPMTSGHQCLDYDLATMEHAKVILLMGTNLLATKMPDVHWITESRLKGAHIIDISIDYHATANKADDVVIIRPGTDCAFALGLANVLINEKLYDEKYLLANTDMPLLVRTDTWTNLKASDFIEGYKQAELSHHIKVIGDKDALQPVAFHDTAIVRETLRKEWGDAVVWDKKTDKAVPLSRDKCGAQFASAGVEPALTGGFQVKLLSTGKLVKVVPVFQLVKEYLDEFSPDNTSTLTAAPKEAIHDVAHMLAANRGKGIIATGAGNNHYFNMHLKDRALLLVAALTDNIGHIGGCSFGNFVGNYRVSLYGGLGQYLLEDPFNPELTAPQLVNVKDRKVGMAKIRKYAKDESAHYYNYGDRPLRVGNRLLTDPGHMPAPTKSMWQTNSNSSIGNSKGHYDLMINTMPKWELVMYGDWNWTTSCEYSDIVWAVDSWMETKHTDMSASCTNSFMFTQPITPMKRVHDTKGDVELYAGVSRALAQITGDKRFADYWHFVNTPGESDPSKSTEVYLQRIVNNGQPTRGYDVLEVRDKAVKKGVPTLLMNRTYPRVSGWEQANEGTPWYTKTGRLEFYKDDARQIEAG